MRHDQFRDPEARTNSLVALPVWVVEYLVELAYCDFQIAVSLIDADLGSHEFEAMVLIAKGLEEAST